MTPERLEADYLVVGAGAMGMAFADEILSKSPNDRIVMVDKHARPGGHWNDAYPFVSLHQPAAYYGVNSEKLGRGGAALASGPEILSYFDRVLRKWLDTGRLQHFPMCTYEGDDVFHSLVEPDRKTRVTVCKKTVDATYMNVEVPSTRPPAYGVSPGVELVPLNDLPKVREPRSEYVVIGAGKTGIDAVVFLLDPGVGENRITWIMPNDSWLLDRAQIQPGAISRPDSTAPRLARDLARAGSLEELLLTMEGGSRLFRLDAEVWPTKFRCATVSHEELQALRQIENVVRLGRVVRIEPGELVLEEGRRRAAPDALYIDCTANGLAKREVCPVFQGKVITLQSLFMCQQVFSASVIAHVESLSIPEEKKNEFCQPVPHPELNRDFVAATAVSASNMRNWGRRFGMWLRRSRLCMLHHEPLLGLIRAGLRERRYASQAAASTERILEQEFPGRDFSVPTDASGKSNAAP
ncbi:MAG: NAD(P)-binding protein [Myxococcota bacterium]